MRRLLALPLAGVSLLAAVLANDIGTGLICNHVLDVLLAETLALTLLLRIIAAEHSASLKSTADWPMCATSFGSFVYAAWITHYLEWTEWNTTRALLLATVGLAAGVFAYFRPLNVLLWCVTHPGQSGVGEVVQLLHGEGAWEAPSLGGFEVSCPVAMEPSDVHGLS